MTLPDVVEICSDLVRIPSVGPEHGEGAAVGYLTGLFERIDRATCTVLEGEEGRPNLICELDSGVPGPTLILNGHTDTVPIEPGPWSRGPFSGEIAEGQVWGRGSCDMKGGVAALARAALSHAEAGGPRAGRLLFTATADEDADGYWGLPWLVRTGRLDGDAAIVAEPAGVERDFEQVYIATRGSVAARVTLVTPPGGHSSAYSPERPHAVALAARLQQALEERFRPAPTTHPSFALGPTVVVGELHGDGQGLGFLPERASLTVECRVLPGSDRGTFLAELTAFVAAVVDGHGTATVELAGRPEPWGPPMGMEPDHPLATAALAAVHSAGYGDARLTGWPAFSEAGYLAALGIPTLPGLGPGRLAHAHLPDEHVSVAALRAAVGIYLELFDRILVEDSIITVR